MLEGGAMRGMFTAGVTDVMMENGIEFDGAIGVSAGAAFGCNYKSKQIGRAIRYNMKYCNDERYCGFKTLLKTGDIYGVDFCYHQIPEKLDLFDKETYRQNPMDFYVVCTDVQTGEAIYHKCGKDVADDLLWMRASASMPLVSRVVEIEDIKALDGGMADSIPLKYFESIGYERNVVILTQPEGYIKKKNKFIPVMKIRLKNYPKLIETVTNRHNIYNDTLKYIRGREESGEALVIRPPEMLKIGAVEHNPDNLKRVYELGRKTAEKRIEEIEKFLG